MNYFTLYHNPRCSKSREALNILKQHHIEPMIIEYLKTPLSYSQIKALREHFNLKDFVRYHEPIFKTLQLDLNEEDRILHAMSSEAPILMQRPILTYGECAVIGRPVENILRLLKQSNFSINMGDL